MNIVPWKKELEIGIDLIDRQHYEFLKRANTFVIRFRTEKKRAAIEEQLTFLQDYLLYHFQAEETYQFESGYPRYEEHQAEHKHLVFRVKELSILLQDEENQEKAIDEFVLFVNKWVIGHTLSSDLAFSKHYNEYLKEKKI